MRKMMIAVILLTFALPSHQIAWGQRPSTGDLLGAAAINGLARGLAQGLASQDRRVPYYPPGRPPYPPGRPPGGYYQQPRTVYIQQQAPATPTAAAPPVQVEVTATSSSSSSSPLSLTPNITRATVKAAPKDVVKKIRDALKKDAIKQWDKIADGFDETMMNDEKAAVLAKKLLDEGGDTKKVSELLLAIENGEADIASRLITDLTGDPLKANQVAKEMKFGALLAEITDQLAEGEFTVSDINTWKKSFAKMKLAQKQQRTIDRCLAALKGILEFVELLGDYKEYTKVGVPVPTDPVTIVFCPCLTPDSVYVLDSTTFIVGTKDDMFSVDEGYLGMLATPPVYAGTPIAQTTTDVNAVTLVNSSSQTATYYLDDNTARTLAPGTQASFALPSSNTVSVNSRGRKTPFNVGKGKYVLSYGGNNTWSISATQVSVTLDNTANFFPLHCFINRNPHTVAPGDRLDLNAASGIIDVRFARDEDMSSTARYQFDTSGTYKIGIDRRDGKWALFSADAVPVVNNP